MLKKILIIYICIFALLLNSSIAYSNSILPAGTIVPIRLTRNINSDNLDVDDVISITVIDDVKLDNKLVFKKGTTGLANVVKAKHSHNHGGAGYIEIKDAKIADISGNTNILQLSLTKEGEKRRGLSIFTSIIGVGLILIPFGVWMKGEPAIINSSQIINAITIAPIEVE